MHRPRRSAPEYLPSTGADITLIFDGGSLGNPGKGYGSYLYTGTIEVDTPVQVEFEGRTTSNEAEYRTLIHGLRDILRHLSDRGTDASNVSLGVLSDSQLVVEQLNGRWKVRKAGLQPLHAEASRLLRQFKSARVEWHPRLNSVLVLGH